MTQVLIDAPENINLKTWLDSLPVIIEIDGVTYSHAGIANEWSGAEDSGGLWGYYGKLEIMKDPKHEDYKEILEWMDEDFDPEEFDPAAVVFR